MTGKIQKFLWTMHPSHTFPRNPGEDYATYYARFAESVETLAADCIDSINQLVNNGNVLDDVRQELKQLYELLSQMVLPENTNDVSFSENKVDRVCRTAMIQKRCRLIDDVLKNLPKPKKSPNAELENAVLKENHSESKVISGTAGLAEFLGCGKTKAFEIIKSGILKENQIQYMVGKSWKFNPEKLKQYLAEHPEGLK